MARTAAAKAVKTPAKTSTSAARPTRATNTRTTTGKTDVTKATSTPQSTIKKSTSKAKNPETTTRKNGVTKATPNSRSTVKKTAEKATKALAASQKAAKAATLKTKPPPTKAKASKASAVSKKSKADIANTKAATSKAKNPKTTTRKNGVTKATPKSRSTVKKTAEKVTKALAASQKAAKAAALKAKPSPTTAKATKAPAASKKPTKAATAKAKATKAPAASKKTAKTSTAMPKASATKAKAPEKTSKKRGRDDDDEVEAPPPPPAKKARIAKLASAKPKINKKINKAPTQRLDVFVNGENSAGELGLGPAKRAIDVKRPRLNPLLKANEVGVVQVACGGMHLAALTHDNKILTWGINDQGQLGRDTGEGAVMKSIDDNNSVHSEDSDSGLNPLESTPMPVSASSFPEGTTFVKLSAGDGHTLALTDEGLVYGWGQYRKTDGVLGFMPGSKAEQESKPVLLSGLSKIVHITSGANHAMAMDNKGAVYIWGNGEQNQLGYHVIQRTGSEGKKLCLKPQPLRTKIRKYLAIYTGSDHSFAIDQKQRVWAWGVNNYGACGIAEGAGDDNAAVFTASHVKSLDLENDTIAHISGGQNHSIAVTSNGKALIWGSNSMPRLGLDITTVAETSIIRDAANEPRIVVVPTEIPNVGKTTWASAGSDHTYLINDQGHAYSWGLGATNQLGLGDTKDISLPTHIDNTAVRGRKLEWSGCGGQYSMLAAAARDEMSD